MSLLFTAGPSLLLEAQAPRQSDVEAAYVFNFAKFMQAPSQPGAPFTIGVLGKSGISATLETMTEHELIGDRPLRLIHVQSSEEARRCDILFISDTEGTRIEHDLDMVQGNTVLTVSDTDEFLSRGGMIQFVLVGNRVRFSINLDAVRRSRIQLSSELLKVALDVRGAGHATEVRP